MTSSAGSSPVQRRVVTEPAAFQRRPTLSTDDLAGTDLYVHPRAEIVSVSTPMSMRLGSSGTPTKAGTLPWKTLGDHLEARGRLRLCLKTGGVPFLDFAGGNFTLPMLHTTQCWCVDQESRFAIQRGQMMYRIDLPFETDEDKSRVEEFKKSLNSVIKYEKTQCPFKRGIEEIEIPEEASSPRMRLYGSRQDTKSDLVDFWSMKARSRSFEAGQSSNLDGVDERAPTSEEDEEQDLMDDGPVEDERADDSLQIEKTRDKRSSTAPVSALVSDYESYHPSTGAKQDPETNVVPPQSVLSTPDSAFMPAVEETESSDSSESVKNSATEDNDESAEQASSNLSSQLNGPNGTHQALNESKAFEKSPESVPQVMAVDLDSDDEASVQNSPDEYTTASAELDSILRSLPDADSSTSSRPSSSDPLSEPPQSTRNEEFPTEAVTIEPLLEPDSINHDESIHTLSDDTTSADDESSHNLAPISEPSIESQYPSKPHSLTNTPPNLSCTPPNDYLPTPPTSITRPTHTTSIAEPRTQPSLKSSSTTHLTTKAPRTAKAFSDYSHIYSTSDDDIPRLGLFSQALNLFLGPPSGLINVLIGLARRAQKTATTIRRGSGAAAQDVGLGLAGKSGMPGSWRWEDSEEERAVDDEDDFGVPLGNDGAAKRGRKAWSQEENAAVRVPGELVGRMRVSEDEID